MPLADDPEAKKYILIYHDTENRNVLGVFLKKTKKVLKKGLTSVAR